MAVPKREKIKLRAQKGLLDNARFYRILQENCNYMDIETIKMVYLGVVKTVSSELRKEKFVRLPHLCDFAISPTLRAVRLAGKDPQGRYILVKGGVGMNLRVIPISTFTEYFSRLRRSGAFDIER